MSGIRRGVNEVFALQGCYAAWINAWRRFGTTNQFKGQAVLYLTLEDRMSRSGD